MREMILTSRNLAAKSPLGRSAKPQNIRQLAGGRVPTREMAVSFPDPRIPFHSCHSKSGPLHWRRNWREHVVLRAPGAPRLNDATLALLDLHRHLEDAGGQ